MSLQNNTTKQTTLIKTSNIPISVHDKTIGQPLTLLFNSNNYITYIELLDKNEKINFLDRIKAKNVLLRPGHLDKIEDFYRSWKFYLVGISNIRYVLGINKISDTEYRKIRFSLNGFVLNNITDSFLEDKGDSLICRREGTSEYFIRKGSVVSKKQEVKLFPLARKHLDIKGVEDPNIGVIDTETYETLEGNTAIYCLGFKTNLSPNPVVYYVNSTYNKDTRKLIYNSNEIVLELINELLKPKYDNITFYCHNFGGFDVVFILKVLLEYNDSNTDNKYLPSVIFRDNNILSLKITHQVNGNKRTLTIKDSYALLTNSLKKLGKDFQVDTLKGVFPYKFSTQENLFYIGDTPSKFYYNDISEEDYNILIKDNWDFKEESIKYLKDDLMCLYQVISKANKQVFLDYGLDMHDSLTISKLAVNLFLSKYYKDNIPNINKPSIYNDIKEGYYGGITEVYKPYGENLYYYDVNSLYPYVALQDMPGLVCSKEEFYTGSGIEKDIDEYFGFFYCEIETPLNSYLGLLPVRNKNGIEFPLGKWKGWYFSEELKFAKANGYKIKMLKGYSFNRESNVFKNYIEDIYKIKCNPVNSTQKSMAKSLLNNLLGRFGIQLDKPVTDVVSVRNMDTICTMRKVTSYTKISENKFLLTYINKLDAKTIASHNLDIIKILNKYKDIESPSFDATSLVISAAVTAYARIHISKLKLGIIQQGGEIYYSDTDSIVTNIKLAGEFVSAKDLGKLKLEDEIAKGIFITGKTYCFIDKNGKFINKAKGIKSSSLEYNDYLELLNNKNIHTAIKSQSTKNWVDGYVKIEDMNVKLNADSYKKRIKIYNKLAKWIDTKPNWNNQLDLSLIQYIPRELALIIYNEEKVVKTSSRKVILSQILMIVLLCISFFAYLVSQEESASCFENHESNKQEMNFPFKVSDRETIQKDENEENRTSSHLKKSIYDDEDNTDSSDLKKPIYDDDSTECDGSIYNSPGLPEKLEYEQENSLSDSELKKSSRDLDNTFYGESSQALDYVDTPSDYKITVNLEGDKQVIFDEEKVFGIIQNNWESFIKNQVHEIFPEAEVYISSNETITPELIDKIFLVKQDILKSVSESPTSSMILSPTSSIDSQKEFEELVKQLKSGKDVTIYSPVYPEFSPLNPDVKLAEAQVSQDEKLLLENIKGKAKDISTDLSPMDKFALEEIPNKKIIVIRERKAEHLLSPEEGEFDKFSIRYEKLEEFKLQDYGKNSDFETVWKDNHLLPHPDVTKYAPHWQTQELWEVPSRAYIPLEDNDTNKIELKTIQNPRWNPEYANLGSPRDAGMITTQDISDTEFQITDKNTYSSPDTRHPSNGVWIDKAEDLGLEELFKQENSGNVADSSTHPSQSELEEKDITQSNTSIPTSNGDNSTNFSVSRETSLGSLIDSYSQRSSTSDLQATSSTSPNNSSHSSHSESSSSLTHQRENSLDSLIDSYRENR